MTAAQGGNFKERVKNWNMTFKGTTHDYDNDNPKWCGT